MAKEVDSNNFVVMIWKYLLILGLLLQVFYFVFHLMFGIFYVAVVAMATIIWWLFLGKNSDKVQQVSSAIFLLSVLFGAPLFYVMFSGTMSDYVLSSGKCLDVCIGDGLFFYLFIALSSVLMIASFFTYILSRKKV